MFQWSNKTTNKTVSFSQEVTDRTLLRMLEEATAKNPHKSFSDLCKEALWHLLGVPESLRPSPKIGEMEQQIAALQAHVIELEQRLQAKEVMAVPQTSASTSVDLSGFTEQLMQLQRQFAGFEQKTLMDVMRRLASLEGLINELQQQQNQPPLPAAEPQPSVVQRPVTTHQWGGVPSSKTDSKPESKQGSSGPAEPSDPVLDRLKNLIGDDF